MTLSTPQRRRGEALELALLDAAWEELSERGYAGLTFDGVARRAGTSRPVLYRRWDTKAALVRATLARYAKTSTATPPDTGSLRGDVIALLSDFNRRRAGAVAVLTVGLGAYFEETGSSLGDIRNTLVVGQRDLVAEVVAHAVARGEIDPARLTPRMTRLPYDLLRNELMLTLRPVPAAVIEEIVDTLFLPLVTREPGSSPSEV